MNMTKLRFLTISLALLLPAAIARADKVWIQDFVISQGETKTVELLLDNEVVYNSLQCDFELPDGLSIVKNANNRPIFTATSRTATHMIQGSQPSGTGPNHYRIGMITMSNPISGNSGAIATFQVTATDDFHGHHVIVLSNIRVGDVNDVSYKLDDNVCNVTTPLSLAELVSEGEEGVKYSVSDILTCAYITNDGMTIYAKDDNAFAMKDVWPYVPSSEQSGGNLIYDDPSTFDQSNWVAINLLEPLSTNQLATYLNHKISGVTGVLKNRMNPEIDVEQLPVPTADDGAAYTPNLYTVASFAESNTYFVMPPKPQEYLKIRWAVYNDGVFHVIKNQNGHNTEDLKGAVKADMSMYDGVEFKNGYMYDLVAIVKALKPRTGGAAILSVSPVYPPIPVQDGEISEYYEIYPISSTEYVDENGMPTAIGKVGIDSQDGVYYNLLGQPVTNPTPGIYIHNGKKVVVGR
jgi:hypothetical protein